MTEVTEDLKNLELDCCDIFKDVKYYITGEVEVNVLELLRNGGAERMNYFSDYVTHLVCGDEPEDTDLSDASDVYEIPAVTVRWVIYSWHLKRLLNTKPYLYNINKLFSNLNFCFSSIGRDHNVLWAIITYYGGNVRSNLDKNCNYLVTTSTISEKYRKASSLVSDSIHIVTPDWVIESVRRKNFAPVEKYHPRLILWPKIVKHESTTAITGFEPDELNISEANLDNILPDSTQALLEELKQRMPWNQPQTSPSSEAAPPNVVAPSYTSSKLPQQLQDNNQQQTAQQRLFSPTQQQLNIQKTTSQSQQQLNFLPSTSQVPRSIVHHPPQSPIQQPNQQLQFATNQQQQTQQIAFPQAAQRFRIIEHVQNRVQRLQQQQQSQFNQFQQQRVQQLQQVSQLQQEGQMGQVNQQQQVVNQQLRQPQSQQQQNQQQLISTNQSQENQRQLLQNIQQQQQLIQTQQLRQAQSQQVTSMAQLQMAQNQQQQPQQHSTLNQLTKSTPTSIQQQQHLSPQQLLQRQIQNQHLLKSQHILQNQQQQLQNQLNQQQQNQQGQTPQNQLGQQLLQTQQSQDQQQQQLNQQQSHLEQQLTQQTQLNQPQQQLNQRQLNQLNQHLLQNQLAQQNQQTQLNQQQQLRQNQISAQQQQLQNRLNIQQQQQSKILQTQFGQPQAQQQQIINQQTVVVSQNQQNVLQQQFGSPNSQQFTQQQTFVQQQPGFNQPQPQPQLIQTQPGQPQVIACQQQQQVQVQQQQQPVQQQQLLAQQQLKPQQIIGQPQLVNQKLNIQQIGGQQHILLQQQQSQQVQGTPESPQRPSNHVWQQQQQVPPPAPTPQPQQTQINIQRHPNIQGQGPRVQWTPNQQSGVVVPQRQYIHLDEQTHQQLQQMSPEDRALFVQKLHKHKVLQRMQAQHQRAGHILIRGGVPIGLHSQPQVQWLQQQAKQQGVVLQQNIPPGAIVQQATPNIQHSAPGLSPIQQQTQFTEQTQQLQLQRQQQQQLRLQQLQLHQQQQREQVQKTALQQQQAPPALPQPSQPTVVRALVQGQVVDNAAVVAGPPPVVVDPNVVQSQSPLVVNSKTKTALANMLNTRLQSGGSTLSENIAEPSAAGTLKLMNAQHNAALNTGNRPHDLLFFQQRRIINRPNGEVIRPPPSQSVPPGPQVDPPKLQFTPRNSVPLQHRPGTYYGHNPNLKLPPDLFLLGCVFVVVELERFLDESMPGWQKKIEKHGGEIEKQYCNRVTHVICETQRHGVVMQALRDFKRCVTLYWLSDVINRKQVLPPWIALHLPTMYWDTAPASKHLICLTGFQGTERDRIKHMIKYIGAGLTTYFSKHNTLLITTKPEGRKYSHAKKWGIPIVNVQWLTDIMLGHFTALNQIEHVKYQHFADPANFSFDPLLVPNLMHAWKMPINISQESYEKVKRSASPVVAPLNSKLKKIKTEQIPVTDENDNEEDPILQSTATHRVLFSMCSDVDELKKLVRQLGGVVAKSFRDCTHLVMPQLKRTHKLLCCICVSTYILPDSWLRDSYAAGKFLAESNYSLDTKEFNSEFKCDFNQTLATKNRSKLFEGKHFFITPSVVPRKKELFELAESCGGIVERNRRTLAQIEATNSSSPYSYVILTHENDLHLVADLLKNKKDKVRIVCNSELILSAILKQTFEVEPYAVKFL